MGKRLRRKIVLILIAVFFQPMTHSSDKECSTESKECVFTGSLETHTYSGEPNYKDIKKGDEAETHLYLKLVQTITIHFKDWDKKEASVTESISLMQIGGDFEDRFFKTAKRKNHVTINGTIFESLVKAIQQFEGWKEGQTNIPLRITKILKDKKKKIIVAYFVEKMGWIYKAEAIGLAKNHKIDAVVAISRSGNLYVRTRHDIEITNNLDVLG